MNIVLRRIIYGSIRKKYNEFIESVAPEIREELIFSPRVEKYLLITHYEDGGADVMVIGNAEQLAREFMLSIAFHVGSSPQFNKLSKLEHKEKMRKEILSKQEFITRYRVLSDDVINAVRTQAMDAYYNDD